MTEILALEEWKWFEILVKGDIAKADRIRRVWLRMRSRKLGIKKEEPPC
jgi:hypothetical protein